MLNEAMNAGLTCVRPGENRSRRTSVRMLAVAGAVMLMSMSGIAQDTTTPKPDQAKPDQPKPDPSKPEEAKSKESKEPTKEPSKPLEKQLRIWFEFPDYVMTAFNRKLASEGNNPIHHRVNFGVEANVVDVPVPFFKSNVSFKTPAGIEYLGAFSTTTFEVSAHPPVTVKWNLPVVGVFVSPTLTVGKREWLYLRPIGVGYYMLGKFASAKLTITDRSGRLDVSGSAPGLTSAIGLAYPTEKWKFIVETGYRRLQFNDATLQPREGFSPESGGVPITQASTLPQQLDYSGLMVRTGVLLIF